MKNKILAVLLIGFLASCAKQEIKPEVSINGTWRIDGLTNTYTINLIDSTFTIIGNNKKIKQRCYLLKFNRINIDGTVSDYSFDDHDLLIAQSEYYR